MKIKRLLKAVVFAVVFVLLFLSVQQTLIPYDALNYQHIAGFYEEREDSLDAVYIGSSNCFIFWNSAFAWKEHGITVYPYACNSLSFYATEHLIKEARKTQPDAMFIVNINAIYEGGIGVDQMYNLLNCMPFSMNKLSLTKYMTEVADLSLKDSIEFYLPVIRYHERYSNLIKEDFGAEIDGYKGATVFNNYFNKIDDISERYTLTEETVEIDSRVTDCIDSLLEYIEEEELDVLFVTVPQAKTRVKDAKRYNAIEKYISERGFDTLDLLSATEEQGLDLTKDFYNDGHVNIHGSIKFTDYLSKYLIENYDQFEDKRGNGEYADWDESLKSYLEVASPYILDFETDMTVRDLGMSAPQGLTVALDGKKANLSWESVEGAHGYAVYRKVDKGPWERITDISADALDEDVKCSYSEGLTGKGKYSYTVVPYVLKDGKNIYGDFSYRGVNVVNEGK